MIIISSIVFLINILIFIFLIRFGNMVVLLSEIVLLLGLLIYSLIKSKRNYIKSKYIIYIMFLSILQFLLFILLNHFDLIYFPSSLDGALNSIITIIFFYVIDVAFVLILLVTNLIKLIINKMLGE